MNVLPTSLKPRDLPFPKDWAPFFNELLPSYVKRTYSPREGWKNKPFSEADAQFFGKGVNELSDLFTEERPKKLPDYFRHPRFRSSYLLYFLPLQAAKFQSLFELHPKAMDRLLPSREASSDPIRILDLGSGPATASIALVLWLLDRRPKLLEKMSTLEIHLWDINGAILEDGKNLLTLLEEAHPLLKEKLKVQTHTGHWWKAPEHHSDQTFSLILSGNVLNETANTAVKAQSLDDERERPRLPGWMDAVAKLSEKSKGAGYLFVEPAFKGPAQLLSRIRDAWFSENLRPPSATSLWGPCLHAEACPLREGRDWCHFSVPVRIPGKWFKYFSIGLGSERNWVKFSYTWFTGINSANHLPVPEVRRVVSDPIHTHKKPSAVLLCEPETPRKQILRPGELLYRGELWNSEKVNPDHRIIQPRSTPKPLGAGKKPPSLPRATKTQARKKYDPAGPLAGASGSRGRKKRRKR